MYKAKLVEGEWVIVDSEGAIVSDTGEFSNKADCKAAVVKLNSDDYAWKHAPACDAPHMDNF